MQTKHDQKPGYDATRLDPALLREAAWESLRKLSPRTQLRNPVMFTVWVGAVLTLGLFIQALVAPVGETPGFILAVSAGLWFTVLFANFAEAVAEGRGKAQAAQLRRARQTTMAKRLSLSDGQPWRPGIPHRLVPSSELRPGDLVLVEVQDLIPGDG